MWEIISNFVTFSENLNFTIIYVRNYRKRTKIGYKTSHELTLLTFVTIVNMHPTDDVHTVLKFSPVQLYVVYSSMYVRPIAQKGHGW